MIMNDSTMIAHIRATDGHPQQLENHCRNTAVLCNEYASPLHLSHTAQLIGLLHDIGKATEAFKAYLISCTLDPENLPHSPHNHAPTGAIYAYLRWFEPGQNAMQRLTAQMIAQCIHGHHAGLVDCLQIDGHSPFWNAMQQDRDSLHYDDAIHWTLEHIASQAELDALFETACEEVAAILQSLGNDKANLFFQTGMLFRLLLSILVDADRWDSACFEYGQNPFEPRESSPVWEALFDSFEAFKQKNLQNVGKINKIRSQISDACLAKAEQPPGVFTLSAPTGGGKTFSSLRFALKHADFNRQARIFYIIPYNTILDQNAKDIREALNGYASILEHQSSVLVETEELKAYRQLTERWDSHIILTSLVQFLNTCFICKNTAARRMHRLANAVLIFDEIQSIPKHCKGLFERAITFLANCCYSTVVLCTATQPLLHLTPPAQEIIPHVGPLYKQLKRVRYLPQLSPAKTNAQAAKEIASMAKRASVLMVVNTKAVAWQIYTQTISQLKEQNVTPVLVRPGLPNEEVLTLANESAENAPLCVHLSKNLCAAHRKELLRWVKLWLNAKKRVLCISTSLIEAGINISFPVVVRSLAAWSSIVQAGGRANRNMEYSTGNVYIWDLSEEVLNGLPDIQQGGNDTRTLISQFPGGKEALDTPEAIQCAFAMEEYYVKCCEDYPVLKNRAYRGTTLVSLLSQNCKCVTAARNFDNLRHLAMGQSFRTAGEEFEVIPQETKAVLVSWGKGKELIAQLSTAHTMSEEIRLLREAQLYSISLYPQTFDRLFEEQAIYPVGHSGVYALAESHYDAERGIY